MAIQVIGCTHLLLPRCLQFQDLQQFIASSYQKSFLLVRFDDRPRNGLSLAARFVRQPNLILLAIQLRECPRPRIQAAHEIMDLLRWL